MYNLLPQKAPYVCISPRKMAGNYIDMQGSVSTDLGKLVIIQLVPKKTAERWRQPSYNRKISEVLPPQAINSHIMAYIPGGQTVHWHLCEHIVSRTCWYRRAWGRHRSCPAQLVTGNALQTRWMSAGPNRLFC